MDLDNEFPERSDWSDLDSHKLRDLAERLSRLIEAELDTYSRDNLPGLRLALRILNIVDEENTK